MKKKKKRMDSEAKRVERPSLQMVVSPVDRFFSQRNEIKANLLNDVVLYWCLMPVALLACLPQHPPVRIGFLSVSPQPNTSCRKNHLRNHSFDSELA